MRFDIAAAESFVVGEQSVHVTRVDVHHHDVCRWGGDFVGTFTVQAMDAACVLGVVRDEEGFERRFVAARGVCDSRGRYTSHDPLVRPSRRARSLRTARPSALAVLRPASHRGPTLCADP